MNAELAETAEKVSVTPHPCHVRITTKGTKDTKDTPRSHAAALRRARVFSAGSAVSALNVDPHQQVAVEGGGDAERVVVGQEQLGFRFHQVGAEQQRVVDAPFMTKCSPSEKSAEYSQPKRCDPCDTPSVARPAGTEIHSADESVLPALGAVLPVPGDERRSVDSHSLYLYPNCSSVETRYRMEAEPCGLR